MDAAQHTGEEANVTQAGPNRRHELLLHHRRHFASPLPQMFKAGSGCGPCAIWRKEIAQQLVRLVLKDITSMGHTRVVIQSDNEPAIKALVGRVRDMRSHPTIMQESSEYEAYANGLDVPGRSHSKDLFQHRARSV